MDNNDKDDEMVNETIRISTGLMNHALDLSGNSVEIALGSLIVGAARAAAMSGVTREQLIELSTSYYDATMKQVEQLDKATDDDLADLLIQVKSTSVN